MRLIVLLLLTGDCNDLLDHPPFAIRLAGLLELLGDDCGDFSPSATRLIVLLAS